MAVAFSRPLDSEGPPEGALKAFEVALDEMKAFQEHADRAIALRYRIERIRLKRHLRTGQVIWKPMRVPGTLEVVPNSYVSNFGSVMRGGKVSWVKLDAQGRRTVGINGKMEKLARVVHVSFYPELGPLPPTMTVDHGNDVRSDDRAVNLKERMSRGENTRQMRLSGLAKSNAAAQSKAIQGKPRDAPESAWETFNSQHKAAQVLSTGLGRKVSDGNIGHVVRGKRPTACGWLFRAIEDPDLPGEQWVDDPVHYGVDLTKTVLTGASVSNLGRWRNAKGGVKIFPAIGQGMAYARVRWQGQTFLLHRVICSSFHGRPPAPDLVADHVDGIKTLNAASNLRWATIRDNSRNENNVDRVAKRARLTN